MYVRREIRKGDAAVCNKAVPHIVQGCLLQSTHTAQGVSYKAVPHTVQGVSYKAVPHTVQGVSYKAVPRTAQGVPTKLFPAQHRVFLQSCSPHSSGCSYKAVPRTAQGCLPGSHLVCISRDAGDTRHTEVKWSQREPCLVHEGNQEPSQAAVHMNRDVVLLSQLLRQTQPPISNLSDGCQRRHRDDLYSPYKCQGKQGTPSQ